MFAWTGIGLDAALIPLLGPSLRSIDPRAEMVRRARSLALSFSQPLSQKRHLRTLFGNGFDQTLNVHPTSICTSASWSLPPDSLHPLSCRCMCGPYSLPALYHRSCLNATSSISWRLIDVGTALMTEAAEVDGPNVRPPKQDPTVFTGGINTLCR